MRACVWWERREGDVWAVKRMPAETVGWVIMQARVPGETSGTGFLELAGGYVSCYLPNGAVVWFAVPLDERRVYEDIIYYCNAHAEGGCDKVRA